MSLTLLAQRCRLCGRDLVQSVLGFRVNLSNVRSGFCQKQYWEFRPQVVGLKAIQGPGWPPNEPVTTRLGATALES